MIYPKIAMLSDIHANAAALRAVLADIYPPDSPPRADEVWSLGDLLGYGSHPIESIFLALGLENSDWPPFTRLLGGNHDGFFSGQWSDLHYFNEHGRFALLMHEALLHAHQNWPASYDGDSPTIDHWVQNTFAAESFELAQQCFGDLHLFARHSLPGESLASSFEYVYPWSSDLLQNLGRWIDQHTTQETPYRCYFMGHTHIPLCCTPTTDQIIYHDLVFNEARPLSKGISILNPGSVGQPRGYSDLGRPFHPSYLILDPNESTVEFRRVPYDSFVTELGLEALADQSEQFPGIAQNLDRTEDWDMHAHQMAERLTRILGNAFPPSGWHQMADIYSSQPWGWQGTSISTSAKQWRGLSHVLDK